MWFSVKHDELHCDMCGSVFCIQDYVANYGVEISKKKMEGGGYILCPSCERKLDIEEQAAKRRVKTMQKSRAVWSKLAQYEPKTKMEDNAMKMKQANSDIRAAVKNAGIKLWMVAAEIGVTDSTMSRWLRFELSASEKRRVLKAVEAAKNKYGVEDEEDT